MKSQRRIAAGGNFELITKNIRKGGGEGNFYPPQQEWG